MVGRPIHHPRPLLNEEGSYFQSSARFFVACAFLNGHAWAGAERSSAAFMEGDFSKRRASLCASRCLDKAT